MDLMEVKRSMYRQGIPTGTIEQFVFPDTGPGTPEERVAFAAQMDALLSKERILSLLEEQGCHKSEDTEIWSSLAGKTVEERIKILNAMKDYARSRLNDDGTLSVFWHSGDAGRYNCVCPVVEQLTEPASISQTFCGCCGGHAKFHFEHSLGVTLRYKEIVSSSLGSGGEKICEHLFEIVEKKDS